MFGAQCARAPQLVDVVKAVVPTGRAAEADEVGNSIVYLCSPAASYVSGSELIVDAGLTLTIHLG